MSEPFEVKDCSLIAMSTGKHARNLREFTTLLQSVPVGSIYHHFWGNRLQPRFEEPEYQNDFASWTRHALHDSILSEQLAILDPTDYPNLEDLRYEVVDILEQRLAQDDYVSWEQAQFPFSFVYAQTAIFDTQLRINDPEDFVNKIQKFAIGSIFYHFIEARRRPYVGKDDFQTWLMTKWTGYEDLTTALAHVDPYFCTLAELRDRLCRVFLEYFGRSRS